MEIQKQRLLSDRQHFQREQMKLLELRSPTTLTPQTPLPLTPSAGVKRQFIVPTTKAAPPPPTSDTAKDTATTASTAAAVTSDEGVAKDNVMPGGMADTTGDNNVVNNVTSGNNSLQNITSQLKDDGVSTALTAAESGGGAELLPPVDEEITNTNAEDLFPIDFPNSDHQSPINEGHMIPEGSDGVQQSMEFESSNQMPSDIGASPDDPIAFDDFDPVSQFNQSNILPETDQSDQLEKLAEQLDQLPQQPVPMDDNTDGIGVQQLEELSNDTS